MTPDELKKHLQAHFTDGLALIVGSGLSCAEGIPGMKALGEHLCERVPSELNETQAKTWKPIAEKLVLGHNLETVMLENEPDAEIENVIGCLTAKYIGQHELQVIQEVFNGTRTLRLSRLFPHLLKPSSGIPIITTNYERLVEIAAEMAGLGVDTLFAGHSFGKVNPKECQMSFCRDVQVRNKNASLRYADRVVLSKPHGSLDWYQQGMEPIRCPIELDLPRLLITPGRNKFRTGYDRPFDNHRERANRHVDRASRFLIVGYGFNDDHLETHLTPRLKSGTPALVLVQSLSSNGKKLLAESPAMTVLESDPTNDNKTLVHTASNTSVYSDGSIWDLGTFVSDILEP